MQLSLLSKRLQDIFQRLRRKGRLTKEDVDQVLREIRVALLEADVHYKVVKDFIAGVRERAVGEEVLASLTPAQQVVKIVNQELTALMGGSQAKLMVTSGGRVLLVGLQGSGKTTTAAKLALHLKKQGRHPLLVAADVRRPAAAEQLRVLGEKAGVSAVCPEPGESALQVANRALGVGGWDVLIIDTAGRLHIDEELMDEVARIKEAVSPQEILLIADAMTGQDAVSVAQAFHERLGLTGIILTRLDGDARGGAALSMRAVTGCPIKFVGTGEKLEALEPFHPDRMASRILGMGDVLTLIEKAEQVLDKTKAQELEKKIRRQEFSLEDFLVQLKELRKMGPVEEILNMLPGRAKSNINVDEKEIKKIEAIVLSMTREERDNPAIINASRRKRIARGSGTTVQDVNRLLKQFFEAKELVRQVQGRLPMKRQAKKFPFLK